MQWVYDPANWRGLAFDVEQGVLWASISLGDVLIDARTVIIF
jgi:hypothetical protein